MKIKEIMNETSMAPDPKKSKPNEKIRNSDFLNSFRKANADLTIPPKMPPAPPSPGNDVFAPYLHPPIPGLGLLPSPENRTIHSQTLQATDRTLEVLERYQRALINPEVSLKKIAPLVESLSGEVEGLTGMSAKLPPTDPLQEMLKELGILSAVEIQKFKRGDYI